MNDMESKRILSFQKLTTRMVIVSLVGLCASGIALGENKITTWAGWITKVAVVISAITSIITIIYFFVKSVKEDMKKIKK